MLPQIGVIHVFPAIPACRRSGALACQKTGTSRFGIKLHLKPPPRDGSRSRQRAVSAARRCLKAAVFSTMAHSGRRQCSSSSNDVSLPLKSHADLPPSGRISIPTIRRTEVTEYFVRSCGSLGLDVGRPDHLAPLFG